MIRELALARSSRTPERYDPDDFHPDEDVPEWEA